MNSILNNMLIDSKQTMEISNAYVKSLQEQELQKQQNLKETSIYHEDSPSVITIKKLGLQIDSYLPAGHNKDEEDLEYYYCSNERWNIVLRRFYECELGYCFQCIQLIEKNTMEENVYYHQLDNDHLIESFKQIISCSKQDYIDKTFGKYYSIPSLLRENGFIVTEHNFTFTYDKCLGYLEIKNEHISKSVCELHIFDYGNYIKSKTVKYDFNKILYNFTYENESDINNLIHIINSLLEHIDGKYGFYENEIYYKNIDIENFFKSYKSKIHNLIDSTTHGLYSHSSYDMESTAAEEEEYSRKNTIANINHANGIEMYKEYKLYLNQDTNDITGIRLIYTFEIMYNKNYDAENCILNIKYNKNNKNNSLDNSQQEHTIKGSFTYIINELRTFLDALYK